MGPRLKFYGWGFEDAVLTGAERDRLFRFVAGKHGVQPRLEPPPLEAEIALRAPRIAPPAALAGVLTQEPYERLLHTYGKSFSETVRAFARDFTNAPDLVALPNNEADIAAVLDWAAGARVAVIPFGAGSSVVGGVEPAVGDGYSGAVSLDMRHFDRVLEVDATSRAARIQGGIRGPEIEAALKPHGLAIRHYPQSFEFSTLGGWIATRAGGHYATGYTHIDDLVEAVEVVTPVGLARSLRVPASGAGPAPDRLWLGSEGALGVITAAWVRVQRRPTFLASAAVRFDRFDAAVQAARAVVQSGLRPANCRLLDPLEAMLGAGVTDGSGRLLLGFESADAPVDALLHRAVELCRDGGGAVDDEGRPARWRGSFLRAPYQRDAMARLGVIVETFETACTWSAFGELHAAVTDSLTAAGAVVACRFTHVYPDGPAPYFTVYAPGRRGAEVHQWDELKVRASEAIAANGGTITHHHAVGRDHRPWYDRERPEPFATALRAAKAALDPAGMLNPGVLVG
jgi:alkyldihydroxyacetonephosphate synthase